MRESLLATAARTSPAPWIVVAAILTGLGLAALTRRPRPGEDADAARTRHGVLFAASLSAAVAAALLGVFVPGPGRIVELKYLVAYLAASVVAAAGFRFPRSAGLALLLAAIVAGAVAGIFSTALRPLSGDVEIGSVVVSPRPGGGVDVELVVPGRPPLAGRLEGDTVVPLIREVSFDDLWPGLGWRRWYRFEGLTACAVVGDQGQATVRWSSGPLRFDAGQEVAELLYRAFEERAARLPGVELRRSEEAAARAFAAAPERRAGRIGGLARLRIVLRVGGEYDLVPTRAAWGWRSATRGEGWGVLWRR